MQMNSILKSVEVFKIFYFAYQIVSLKIIVTKNYVTYSSHPH